MPLVICSSFDAFSSTWASTTSLAGLIFPIEILLVVLKSDRSLSRGLRGLRERFYDAMLRTCCPRGLRKYIAADVHVEVDARWLHVLVPDEIEHAVSEASTAKQG